MEIERQVPHPVLGCLISVLERPIDGSLAELAIVLGDVRAAAVLLVASDREVVVSVDGRDLALGDQGDDLVGVRVVADQIGGFTRCNA